MQTDNIITADAKRCVGELLFGVTTSCVDSTSAFDDIVLSDASFGETATVADFLAASFTPKLSTFGLAKFVTSTVSEGVAAVGLTDERVDIAHTFSYSGTTGSQTVTSAALFNTANSVFAMKDFPSAVSLNQGDDLTVTWQITLG